MDNLKLMNGAMGKTLVSMNTEKEMEDMINELMDITIDEIPDFLRKLYDEFPLVIRKLKVSTVLDLFMNLGNEEALAELEKLCGE